MQQFSKIPTLVSDTSLILGEKFNNDVFERQIIGTLLLDEMQYDKIKEIVRIEMFSSVNLLFAKVVFEILECGEKLTRFNILESSSKNKFFDITSAMIDQYRYCATSDDITRTVELFVYNWYSYQKAINAAYLISDIQSGVDAIVATANFEKRDGDIEQIKENDNSLSESFESQVEATYESIMARRDNPDMLLGISTGFQDMDRILSGWIPQNLYIIGGASGEGKSTLALQIIGHALQSTTSRFYSLEMGASQIIPKMFSAMTGVATLDMATAHITDNDANLLFNAKEELKKKPFKIEDRIFHIDAICKSIRSEVKTKGVRLVCIDHLGIIDHSMSKSSDAVFDTLAYQLKRLTQELNIPIILLAQKNNASLSRANKRPISDDIKYGGKTAADVIIFPYTPQSDDETNMFEDETNSEIVITKNRATGLKGGLKRKFSKSWNLYCEIDIDGNAILPNRKMFPTSTPLVNNIPQYIEDLTDTPKMPKGDTDTDLPF